MAHRSPLRTSLYSFVLLRAITTWAGPGNNDPTFNPTNIGPGHTRGFNGLWAWSMAAQEDGKVIVGGAFSTYNGYPRNGIARLLPDGSLDPLFDPGSGFNAGSTVYALAVQADGKIIASGDVITYGGASVNGIVRLNPDGTRDPSFDTGTGCNGIAWSLALQPDGRILVAGDFTTFNGQAAKGMVRLDPDGSRDLSFSTGAGFSGTIYGSALLPNGKILVGGYISYNGTAVQGVTRLNADGSHDVTFPFGTDQMAVHHIVVRDDGKIIVGGNTTVRRLNANGTLDATFNAPGGMLAFDMLSLPDGRLIVGGTDQVTDAGQKIFRLNDDGTVDPTFDPGTGADEQIQALIAQADGHIIVAGAFDTFNGDPQHRIARISADGALDGSFGTASGFNGPVDAVLVRPDGSVLAGGVFTMFNGLPVDHLVCLHTDGTLDVSFTPPVGLGEVNALVLQPDGKVLVGGWSGVARLMPDGALDPSFTTGTGFSSAVFALALQPDGKVLVGGQFTTVDGIDRPKVARLKADGSLDPLFDPGELNVDNIYRVYAIAVMPSGAVLLGGSFWSFGGTIAGNIGRLLSDGSLDPSFDPGWGLDGGFPASGEVRALRLLDDGRVLACGDFSYYDNDHLVMDGIPCGRIARLNSDGSFDASFTAGSGADGMIRAMARDANGRTVIAGSFTSYNGVTRQQLVRILADGALDLSFDPGQGATGGTSTVATIALQADGRVLLGGDFTAYDGTERHGLARALGSSMDCIPSQLTTMADPVISCGATNLKFDGTSTIAATEVPGANKYQFRFTNIPGQPVYTRNIAFAGRQFTLSRWATNPLKAGRTYNVIVRASFDGGSTWCAFGPSCTVRISNLPLALMSERALPEMATEQGKILLLPNPTDGRPVRIMLENQAITGESVLILLTDMQGRAVARWRVADTDGTGVMIPIDAGIIDGVYIVTLSVGDLVTTRRLVVQH